MLLLTLTQTLTLTLTLTLALTLPLTLTRCRRRGRGDLHQRDRALERREQPAPVDAARELRHWGSDGAA